MAGFHGTVRPLDMVTSAREHRLTLPCEKRTRVGGRTRMAYLARTALRIDTVRVLLAVGADVPLSLANKAFGVGEATVLLLWLCAGS